MPHPRALTNSLNASRRGFWTAERVIVMKFLWHCGMFASEIAEIIGDGCTRKMVIGKANRLHLEARPRWQGKRSTRAKVIRVSCETQVAA